MATFTAAYDLKWSADTPYTEFRNQATKLGWKVWILSGNNVWYRLPNTTLEGDFPDMAAAETALLATREATAAATGKAVIMEKWLVTQYSVARFNSDDQQAST